MTQQKIEIESQFTLHEVFFFVWWTLINVLNVKSPKKQLLGLLLQLNDFFSLSRCNSLNSPLSASLWFSSFSLGVVVVFAEPVLCVIRASRGSTAFFLHFCTCIHQKSSTPVLTTTVFVYFAFRLSFAYVRSCRNTFIVGYIDQPAIIYCFCEKKEREFSIKIQILVQLEHSVLSAV